MAATWRSGESPQRLHTHRSGGLQLATAWRSTHQRPSFPHTVRELLSSRPVVILGGECLSPLSASVQRKLLRVFRLHGQDGVVQQCILRKLRGNR